MTSLLLPWLPGDELIGIVKLAEEAYAVAQEHADEFNLPYGTAYVEAEKLKKVLSKV